MEVMGFALLNPSYDLWGSQMRRTIVIAVLAIIVLLLIAQFGPSLVRG
jgi:hypothetical protein